MTINSVKKQAVSLDMLATSKLTNMPPAAGAGEAVEFSQLNTVLGLKQNVVTGGSGIAVDSDIVTVDLATSGSDYTTFTVSGANYSSLNGTYTRLGYPAYLTSAGLSLDLFTGINIDFNAYYKDNGSGVWALVARREIDGDAATSDGGGWLVALTTTDPTSVNPGSGNVTVANMIPNYQAVDYDYVSNSDVVAENTLRSPAEGYILTNLVYSAGSTPAGLKFDNSKLAIDFAQTTGDAASTKVFPSSVIKNYVDEQVNDAKDLANHPFSNTLAGIVGNPSNAQSAFEALAAENNTQDSLISALQTVDVTHTSNISAQSAALGVAVGVSELPVVTGAGTAFVAGTTASARFQAAANSFAQVYTDFGTLTGLVPGSLHFGSGFTILPDDADAKSLFQATEAELQQLALGQGQFWEPVEAKEANNVSLVNPGTSVFTGHTVSTGDRVLLIGQTVASENGIYIFDSSGTAMVRALDADADADFTPNKTVQVLNSTAEGVAGATFAYTGGDSTIVGSTDLTFAMKAQGVVGDNSITSGKLAAALLTTITDKTNKWAGDVTTDGTGAATFSHGVGSIDFVSTVLDASGEVVNSGVEIEHDSSDLTIQAEANATYRVIVIG